MLLYYSRHTKKLTLIPAFTKVSAIAAPMPALAPVTMATLPTQRSNPKEFAMFLSLAGNSRCELIALQLRRYKP